MFSKDLFDVYQDRIDRKLDELMKLQIEIIELYKDQWEETRNLKRLGEIEEARYLADSYGIKVEDMYIFQLDGLLPKIMRYTIENNRKHYRIARQFVYQRLTRACQKLNYKMFQEPVAIIVIHYYKGNRQFDMDSREKEIMINSLKGLLYKDDTYNEVSFFVEGAIETKDKQRTMIYVGPATKIEKMLSGVVKKYLQIDDLDGVAKGDVPGFSLGFRNNKTELKATQLKVDADLFI